MGRVSWMNGQAGGLLRWIVKACRVHVLEMCIGAIENLLTMVMHVAGVSQVSKNCHKVQPTVKPCSTLFKQLIMHTRSPLSTQYLPQAIRIIGLELRTSNDVAAQTIPAHWQRFMAEGVLARIPVKQSDEVYAVYTHFENAGQNNQGWYSLIIGAPVASDQPVPEGLSHAVIPASYRAVFPVPQGDPMQVGAVWQQVWLRDDLHKTYIADLERFRPNGEIDILVGIDRPTKP